jgi:hypothetical protein
MIDQEGSWTSAVELLRENTYQEGSWTSAVDTSPRGNLPGALLNLCAILLLFKRRMSSFQYFTYGREAWTYGR